MANPAVPGLGEPPVNSGGATMKNGHSLCYSTLILWIAHETYSALESHFLSKGKGRQPTIPRIEAPSNRLLPQLFFLKEDGLASWDTVSFSSA
ncbi:hypothetical protein PoB_005114300 [Plakobranchus ocellatus]|uniref:Uncharacterized protein n=1 Tax=Plakobranchus ocellatus TaxID=259542 RepID=A0AAV4BYC9_9GAST|nr:hypothetical protein PoB_005114300 [Plakobranchus ocellatus]